MGKKSYINKNPSSLNSLEHTLGKIKKKNLTLTLMSLIINMEENLI